MLPAPTVTVRALASAAWLSTVPANSTLLSVVVSVSGLSMRTLSL